MEQVRLWPKNSLPIPFPLSIEKEERPSEVYVDEDDNFPKGEIIKFFPNQGYGFMKDRAGREIYFSLGEMDVVGKKNDDELSIGSVVGYDLSYSGKELHVKKMKIY